jgi:hypothetical protein
MSGKAYEPTGLLLALAEINKLCNDPGTPVHIYERLDIIRSWLRITEGSIAARERERKGETMKRPDIEAIKARLAEASNGEWIQYDRGSALYLIQADGFEYVAQTTGKNAEADAAFIAHARQDIPALLAYVEELEARLKREE